MDQGDSLTAATLRKGEQYDAAVQAVTKGERPQRSSQFAVSTAPLVFGVRGSVDYADILLHLAPFNLHRPDRVLAAGVRAAVAAASTMIDGRKAKLAELAAVGRQSRGGRARTGRTHSSNGRQQRGSIAAQGSGLRAQR